MEKALSDEVLMTKYRNGEYTAFESLYCRHKQPLFRFMLRQCPNQAVTEELFQDVWMKLIDARERYTPQAKFTTYLYQIARNRIIDHFRKHATSAELNQSVFDTVFESLADRIQQQPEQQVEMEQTTNMLVRIVDTLPPEQKEVFLLKEEAGMSLSEIAELLNENAETVKSRLRYAIKKIREGMDIV